MRDNQKFRAIAATFLFTCLLLPLGGVYGAPGEFRMHDEERLRSARQAGLRADRTHVPDLIAILQEKPTPTRFLMETTLHSLAQLGATDALPALNALTQSGKGQDGKGLVEPNVVNAARAARARLVAEAAAGPDTGSPVQAQAKLDHFYSELGETPTDLNAALQAYTKEAAKPGGADIAPKYPVELYAVRQLADIAYRSAYKGFTNLPGMSQVNFALDARSALKVRLAPLSDAERASWLVQDLSTKAVVTDPEQAEIQLAGELGTTASAIAGAKLQEMDQNHTKYGRAAFNALFGVLSVSGGPERILLKHFESDPNPFIAEYARNGGTSEFIAGY